MVNKVGEPYKMLFLGCYTLPTLQIHATLASAFSQQAVVGTARERNVHDAEFAFLCAMLTYVAVLKSQDQIFSLGVSDEVDALWNDVVKVWAERSSNVQSDTGQ